MPCGGGYSCRDMDSSICVARVWRTTNESILSDAMWIGLPVSPFCGAAVVGAWTSLLLSSSWHTEKSWIDRAGRVLGLYWVGTIAVPFWPTSH